MKITSIFLTILLLASCAAENPVEKENVVAETSTPRKVEKIEGITLVVLGNVQDAGSPQIGCTKQCCEGLFKNPDHSRKVVSLGLVDPLTKRKFLFEATPDIVSQMKYLAEFGFDNGKQVPDGIFLTHAHIGHYAGLMYLGKEAMNADEIPVYAMPRMKGFLESNGPWSQLVSNENITIIDLESNLMVQLSSTLDVTPFVVPHRDEFSETVGYIISTKEKAALFVPDIDKWEKWDEDIIEAIKGHDYVFLDATFFDGEEINNRDISEIPHPFIIESMERFKDLSPEDKKKVHFIHFNHTNPALNEHSEQTKLILKNGFSIARFGDTFTL